MTINHYRKNRIVLPITQSTPSLTQATTKAKDLSPSDVLLSFVMYKKGGALTGLAFVDAGRRKAQVFAGALIHGPRVAHAKFGPVFGVKPAPIGAPCIACEPNGSGD